MVRKFCLSLAWLFHFWTCLVHSCSWIYLLGQLMSCWSWITSCVMSLMCHGCLELLHMVFAFQECKRGWALWASTLQVSSCIALIWSCWPKQISWSALEYVGRNAQGHRCKREKYDDHSANSLFPIILWLHWFKSFMEDICQPPPKVESPNVIHLNQVQMQTRFLEWGSSVSFLVWLYFTWWLVLNKFRTGKVPMHENFRISAYVMFAKVLLPKEITRPHPKTVEEPAIQKWG